MNIPTSSYVTWTEQGIDLSTAAVSSLPIEDGSICWGAWIEAGSDPKLKDPTLPERVRAKLSPNQLVITPLPPDTWPISFCLQLELSDDANSLAFATRVIHALGLNIVSARTAPSGFSHTTWTVVCEAPELRRKAFHHTRSLRHSLSNSRVDLLGTAAFWPPGPGVKIELTEEQVSKIETASDSEPFPIALDSRQISKIEKEFPTRTVKDKSVSISKEQKDQIVEIRKHDSSNGTKLFELSAQQSVDLFLLRRAKKLDHKPQEEIWRDFAFVLAERLLIRMHEALWCLRLISHFQEAISIGVKEETGRILDRVNSVVTGWMGKDEANKRNLAAMVRALKFVLDNVGSDDMSKRFDKDRGPDTPFAVALHSVSEACGFKDDAVLRSSFTKENRHGFLHFRFLYGLDEFLVKKSDLSDVFTEYVGDFREDSPLDDRAAKGGQSLQRILNGIKHDGEVESLGLYKDMIGDLIDRSNELDAHVLRLKPEERENFKLHQRLKFLLSIDAKRRT